MSQALLVVGSQRSGTTLLNRILNAHPEINLLYQQSNFLRFDIANLPDNAEFLVTEARKADSVYSKRFTDEIERQLLASLPRNATPGAVYPALIRALSGAGEATYWGEKYAGRCIEALKLFDVEVDRKIVHIVRDPRDVCASERRRLVGSGFVLDSFPHLLVLHDWNIGLFIGDQISRHAPHSYLRISYEALVGSPEATLRRICDFLGLGFDPAMLATEKFQDDSGEAWVANSHFEQNVNTLQDFRGRWKKHLPKEEAIFIEQFCHAGMRQMGYAPEVWTWWRALRHRDALRRIRTGSEATERKNLTLPGYRLYQPKSFPMRIDFSKLGPIYRNATDAR
jgi:LPS sulfotransferase NodH